MLTPINDGCKFRGKIIILMPSHSDYASERARVLNLFQKLVKLFFGRAAGKTDGQTFPARVFRTWVAVVPTHKFGTVRLSRCAWGEDRPWHVLCYESNCPVTRFKPFQESNTTPVSASVPGLASLT